MLLRDLLGHPLVLRLRIFGCVLMILILLGLASRPLEAPAWAVVRAAQPEMNLEAIEGSLGQGLIIGVLGGFRSVLADFLWIRANTIWEKRDRVALDAMLRLVTTLDPKSEFFWVNSARMIAYDVPNWRIREEGGHSAVPEARQQAIDAEQAEQAFVLLRQALNFHPDNPKLYLEFGQIYLNRLKDNENAAVWYLEASKMPEAPYFAARVYAELLKRMDRHVEAYSFLRELHQRLPDMDPYAQRDVVLERIHLLEQQLQIPAWERYQP